MSGPIDFLIYLSVGYEFYSLCEFCYNRTLLIRLYVFQTLIGDDKYISIVFGVL